MRWQLVGGYLADDQGRPVDEGQTVEFKESLAEEDDAIQSAVAFANAQGGRVFFGVKNNASVCGIDVGQNTEENLANSFKAKTYPTIPVTFESIEVGNGKRVLVVDAPQDVPPVIGVYLYSSAHIQTDQPVDAAGLRAYRRVGKTDQNEDFMWLRPALPSDPKLRLSVRAGTLYQQLNGSIWAEEGSATAHDIRIRLEPPVGTRKEVYEDLPCAYSTSRGIGFKFVESFTIEDMNVMGARPERLRVIATFKDDRGITWESVRAIEFDSGKVLGGGHFGRRIVGFPRKAET